MTGRGFTTGDAGLAIGAYGFGQLLASIFGGHMADTLGRRKTIVCSMFSAAVSMLLLSQARSLPSIILFAALAGLTGELYRPAGSAMLTDLVPSDRRVTAFAAYRLAFNAGWAFGPATAGFLAGYSFFWLFVGDALTSLAYGMVAWAYLPESRPSTRREAAWGDAWASMRRDRAFQRAMVASLAITLVFLQTASSYGLYVTSLGHSERIYGLLLSLNGVLIVCFELPLTEITRRYPARRLMALGYALIGGGFSLNYFARTFSELLVPMVLFTVGEMLTIPLFGAHIANLAPEHLRGRYMGVWALTGALALIVGPNLGIWLFRTNPPVLWAGSALLGLAAAGIILFDSAAIFKSTREEPPG
jgi:MFS family permease